MFSSTSYIMGVFLFFLLKSVSTLYCSLLEFWLLFQLHNVLYNSFQQINYVFIIDVMVLYKYNT